MKYFARPAARPGEQPQLLREHLQQVASRAASFAKEAGLDEGGQDAARWAGLLHDLGKYSDEFQQHRLCLTGLVKRVLTTAVTAVEWRTRVLRSGR